VVSVLVFAGMVEAEQVADRFDYGQRHDDSHAAEAYSEDQSTLLLYLPHRYPVLDLKPNIEMRAIAPARVFGPPPEDNGERRWEWAIHVGPKGFRGTDSPSYASASRTRTRRTRTAPART
jgi:hypothetical protein